VRFAIVISVVLFVAACAVPALEFKRSWGPPEVWRGWEILAFGWSGLFALMLGWLANPVWIASLFRPRVGWIAMAIAATIVIDMHRTLPGDEGGVTTQVISRLLPGFYLWMASLLTLPLFALTNGDSSFAQLTWAAWARGA